MRKHFIQNKEAGKQGWEGLGVVAQPCCITCMWEHTYQYLFSFGNLVHQIRQHSDLHKSIVIYKERLQDEGLFSIMFSIFLHSYFNSNFQKLKIWVVLTFFSHSQTISFQWSVMRLLSGTYLEWKAAGLWKSDHHLYNGFVICVL